MGRTGPLWKTSPPSSLRWTPASPSTRRPPYPSSRAQNWGQTNESNWSAKQVYLLTSSQTTTQAVTEPGKTEDEVQGEEVALLLVVLTTSASSSHLGLILLHHGLATLKWCGGPCLLGSTSFWWLCDLASICLLVLCMIVRSIIRSCSGGCDDQDRESARLQTDFSITVQIHSAVPKIVLMNKSSFQNINWWLVVPINYCISINHTMGLKFSWEVFIFASIA